MMPRLRKEVMRFDRYREQFVFLWENGISTQEDMAAFQTHTEKTLASLTKKRTILNVWKKRRRKLFDALADVEALAQAEALAVFADENNTQFRDSKEFAGSIFTQLEETFSYLMLCNKNTSIFQGLERVDSPDYPEAALREALLNALIHRDYSFSGSVIIKYQ